MSLALWNELGGIPLYHLEIYCQLLNTYTSIPSDINFSQTSDNKSPKLSPEELANEFLIQAIKLSSKPFLKKYSSDEITAQSLGIKCFDQLSFLLQNNRTILIQKGICESICEFYVSNCKQKDLTREYQQVSSEFCQNVIMESTVLTSILESIILQLENQGNDLLDTETYTSIKYKLNVLHTLLTFKSSTSIDFENKKRSIHCKLVPNYYKTCNFLLKQVFKKIENFNDSRSRVENGEMVGIIVDILFEVLCEQTSINDMSNSNQNSLVQENIINSLFKIFLNFTKNCTSSKQKKRRNDLLMLFTIFVENNPEYFVSSGSIEILLNFAIQPERYPLNPKFKLKITSSNEDFEFKKLTWLFINKISIFPAALQSISENKILSIFFHFITTPKLEPSQTDFQKSKQEIFQNFSKSLSNSSLKNKSLSPWRSAQKFELECLALDCLCNLTPILLQDFMECFGVTKLIQFLQFCLKDQKSHNCDRLKSTLKVVRQIVVLDCEPINEEFVDQGIVQMIVLELTKRQNVNAKIDIDIKQDLLFILAVICEYSIERKDILGMTGVNLFIQYLNICVNGLHINEKNSIPNSEQILIVYVVDCLWACISGANTTEKMFIESSGIYLLLDALERANKAIYPILLGAICELSDNEMALNHIVSWKSSINGKTNSMELFLNIWNQVENFESEILSNGNYVIDTIFETPHAKIFTLCEKLANQKFDKKLTKNYQITLLSVKNYLDSKILSSWTTVGHQLKEIDKIEPVHCDCEFLNAVAEEKGKKSEILNNEKMELQEKIDQECRMKEQQIYKSTKLAYFSLECRHKRWQKKLKTTSNYGQLIRASEDRMAMLEESRKFQNLEKIDCQNIVKHELVYPLKHNTTSHSKSLAIDT